MWRHIWLPVTFILVVDNFGVKCIGVEQLKHLIKSLKQFYEIELDITGTKYCGITLEWDYANRTVDLPIPKYVPTKLKELIINTQRNHNMPHTQQNRASRTHRNQ